MKVWQQKFTSEEGWKTIGKNSSGSSEANLVMVYGEVDLISPKDFYSQLKTHFPNAHILLNSTAGEITDTAVDDHTVSLTAIRFDKTRLQIARANVASP